MTQMSGSPMIIGGASLLLLTAYWIATTPPPLPAAILWPLFTLLGSQLIGVGAYITYLRRRDKRRRTAPTAEPPRPMTMRHFRQRWLKFEIYCNVALLLLLGGVTSLLTRTSLTLTQAMFALLSTYAGFLLISNLAFRAFVHRVLRHTDPADNRTAAKPPT